MARMILVTGATGVVGGEAVRQLTAMGERVRVLVRNALRFPEGVEVVRGDLSKPDTLGAAFEGVERVFLVAAGPELPRLDRSAVDAASKAGVKHLVKLSAHIASVEPSIQIARWHLEGEMAVKESAMAWTILRPTTFASNALRWVGSIKAQGTVFQATGDGKVAVIDPRDVAAVAVTALTRGGHEAKEYVLTGPEALSGADQARAIGAAIRRPVRFVDVPEEVARSNMLKAGMPAAVVSAVLELMALVKAGKAAAVTGTVELVLGRPSRPFEAWAKANAAAFGVSETETSLSQ
jgi:(4-alkanoyl-5-oxo-2,5-dihydrofuran-3-yl)methyl phosphate reductase